MFHISEEWKDFKIENQQLLERCWKMLNRRRRDIHPLEIYPSDDRVFEVLSMCSPQNVKRIIILPHPYSFDSGTGIPCMVKRGNIIPKSLINIQKAFDVMTDDFSELWKNGILLFNVSLTEESSRVKKKIPHEIMWSLLFERFLEFMSKRYYGICFVFTETLCNKYRRFIDLTNNHNITECPAITSDNFAKKIRMIQELGYWNLRNLEMGTLRTK